MSKTGCRLGARCKFAHDRRVLTSSSDSSSRCYECSGVGHRSGDCPTTRSTQDAQTSDDKGKGNKGGGKASGKGAVIKRVEEDTAVNDGQKQLLAAATTLIEKMQAKALAEFPQLHRKRGAGERTGLIVVFAKRGRERP